MTNARAIFSTAYPLALLAVSLWSLYRFAPSLADGATPSERLLAAGVLLAEVVGVCYVAWVALSNDPGRSRVVNAATGAALTASVALVGGAIAAGGPTAARGFAYVSFVVAGWWLFESWYPRLPQRSAGLHVGEAFPPDLRFRSLDGSEVAARDLRGAPALMLFYRGDWCPLCMAQLREVAGQYRELSARGIRTYFVSPQPERNTLEVARKFDVPVTFLRDVGNRTASAIGVAHEGGVGYSERWGGFDADTVLPTVVLLDEGGVVRFVDVADDIRVRPTADEFLRIADQHLSPTPRSNAGARTGAST